jgi:long-subunit fatty acid transport protein
MRTILVCLVAVLTICSASQLFAITDEEIFRAFSLNLSTPGARARAMGGAFIGRADDATAAETNPAGLSLLVRPEISVEYGFRNTRTVGTNIVEIPVTNFDLTPTPINNPQPTDTLDPVTAEFHASDTLDEINQLTFLSVVYPIQGITIAFSRHELIKTEARIAGGISSSPFHFVEPNDFVGEADIYQVNYGISAAGKVGDYFSIGGNLKIADFSFNSSVAARQKTQPFHGEHFTSSIDTDDIKIGFTGGVLVRPNSKLSFGAVYRYEPKFELDAVVNNADFNPTPLIVSRDGVNQIDFDVPDSLGVGVSISPNPNWSINLDVVRVLYSQLEDVETGFSLFTHLLPIIGNANQIAFSIDDGTNVHVGSEYLWTHQDWIVAFRGGYYREQPNRFFLASAANPEIEQFLQPVFGGDPGDDYHHITFGGGLTYHKFQLDFAFDLTPKIQTDEANIEAIEDGGVDFILSSVFRF